ncbi:MAG TPA: DUF5694 domain-containing protein [Rhizomicrobium sp.]|nr:DUF5694 domain-containing protein [Rhizomicrobium sp.]
MRAWPILILSIAFFAAPAMAADKLIEVMIVGGFHMSGGHDMHNAQIDDMLAPKRQAEIQAVVDRIAKFKPTMVDAEWDEPYTAQKYADYLAGKLPPSHNEVVQLGFRLAKQLDIPVHGIDVTADFPYEPVEAYAKAHGEMAILDSANADVQKMVDTISATLKNGTVSGTLRYLNEPSRIARDNAFYREMLLIGGGKEQPGADLLSAWYKRNAYICANLVQLAKPGDRVVVFYGSGHAFLLRQCVTEMPGYKLVEANDYLPE